MLGKDVTYMMATEVTLVSVVCPVLVWVCSISGERLARETSQDQEELLTVNRTAQHEIAERKRIEEALRESETRFRTLTESAASAVFIYQGTRNRYANPAAEALTGYTRKELLAMSFWDVVHPEFREYVKERGLESQRAGEVTPRYEIKLLTKQGEERWVEFTAGGAIPYDGSAAVLMTAFDITQRKHAEEAERLRAQELESLVNTAGILARSESFEEKCNRVLEELVGITQGDRVVLMMFDEKQQGLRPVAATGAGLGGETPDPLDAPEHGLGDLAFQQARPIVVNDYASFPGADPRLVECGVRSSIALPIQAGGQRLGVITFQSQEPSHFTPQRITLITAVADGIGALLENARLYQEIRFELDHGRRRLEAFQAAANKLALDENPGQGLQRFVDLARMLVEARYGAVVLWDPPCRIKTWFVSGLSPEEQQAVGAPPELGLLGMARDAENGFHLNDAPVHPKAVGLPSEHLPVRSFLGAPIIFKGRHAGAFYLATKDGGGGFSAEDERLLGLFAALAGVHLENAGLYEEVTRERGTLAAIQASMTEGLMVTDADGRMVYFNQAAETLLGVKAVEVLGKSVGEVLHDMASNLDNLEALEAALADMGDSGGVPATVEVTVLLPERRQLLVTVFPIPDGPGKGMTGLVMRDITQERDLKRRRDAFVSTASHELRTPMTAILGFTELLLQQDPPEAMRRDWLGRIHRDSQRLAVIVDDMLNVSRIQSGKLSVNLEVLELRWVVEEIVAEIRPITEKHELLVEIPPDIPCVLADRQKLGQVLWNLLDNAVKYSPQGGPITISAYYEPDRHRVVMAVADQGVGIAPDEQERLFTTFYRIHRPETESVGGSGLGLYIVKGLLELMQGEVWLESELCKGSTFLFSIPAVGAAPHGLESVPQHSEA